MGLSVISQLCMFYMHLDELKKEIGIRCLTGYPDVMNYAAKTPMVTRTLYKPNEKQCPKAAGMSEVSAERY